MSDDTRLPALQALAEPILTERHLELVELSVHPRSGELLIRLLVDGVGGVTIEQCATVNRRLGEAVELANLIEGRYTIEVSSPGLDRPLVSKRDFERAIGEDLDVEAASEDGRVKPLHGMLLAVQHEAIVLKTPSGNVTLPFAGVRGAKKALRW